MDKKKIAALGIVLLIGLLLTGCVGYYGGDGYYDYPYYDSGYRYYGYPYYHHDHEWREHQHGWDEHHYDRH
jgi:hypothetical protein